MDIQAIHSDALSKLIANDDWANLATYWMAHQYVPAMQAAIKAAGRLAERDYRWRSLPTYLTAVGGNPKDLRVQFPTDLYAQGGISEQLTFTLLSFLPRALMCLEPGRIPAEIRMQAIKVGLDGAKKATHLAFTAGESALGAYFGNVYAKGLFANGETEPARRWFELS